MPKTASVQDLELASVLACQLLALQPLPLRWKVCSRSYGLHFIKTRGPGGSQVSTACKLKSSPSRECLYQADAAAVTAGSIANNAETGPTEGVAFLSPFYLSPCSCRLAAHP